MDFSPANLAALLAAVCFAAGLNVYATVGTLGLLGRLHWIALPSGLEVTTHTWMIALCAALFAVEFVADKIPAFDLAWNAAQTFVRVPVAAFLSWSATSHLSPGMQVLATTLGAAIAALAHTSKTAARAAVTASPEPLSNITLSSAEDVGAIGLTWFATHHPYAAGGIAVTLVLSTLLSLHWLLRRMRLLWAQRPAWFMRSSV